MGLIMVIDIGGGTTEIAVIALSGIVSDTSIRTGGDELDQAIVQFMVRFYEGLAGNGESQPPFVVRRDAKAEAHGFGLTEAQVLGLRRALTAVAERGTASAIINATPGSNSKVLQIAGKTGTAQNPHGLDHRWFIAMEVV